MNSYASMVLMSSSTSCCYRTRWMFSPGNIPDGDKIVPIACRFACCTRLIIPFLSTLATRDAIILSLRSRLMHPRPDANRSGSISPPRSLSRRLPLDLEDPICRRASFEVHATCLETYWVFDIRTLKKYDFSATEVCVLTRVS